MPLRQCLHPEACAKDIELPTYYCKFSDLRKEFVRFKSGGLSRALVPVKDVKNLANMPALPVQPASIAEMISGEAISIHIRKIEMVMIFSNKTHNTDRNEYVTLCDVIHVQSTAIGKIV